MTDPIIVIGTGMAGYSFAREFRKLNPDAPLTIISNDNADSYAKPTLSNALSLGKTPEQIALADQAKMQAQLGCTILSNCQVGHIDTSKQSITYTLHGSDQASELKYSKLVLALGASAIVPNLPNATVHTVNHLDDYKQFITLLHSTTCKHITIIGGGLIGCEFANDLVKQQYAVTIVDIAAYPLSRLLPEEIGNQFCQQLTAAGITFMGGCGVSSIDHKPDGSTDVNLSNGQCVQTDIVLSAIGLKPNTSMAQAASIAVNRGIITDRYLATNIANVYAIGDCAEVLGLNLPYVMPLLAQARALAQTLNGNATAVNYPAMPVAVKTPSAPLVVCPVMHNTPVNWHVNIDAGEFTALASDAAGQLQGFALLGPNVGKQRMALAKQIPDWLP